MIHRRTHPFPVEGCAPCRWASVSISAEATPTRRTRSAEIAATEKRWNRDHDAYRRIVAGGGQPNHLDGCADLESYAENKYDLAMMRPTGFTPGQIRQAEQMMDDAQVEHI